MSRPSSSVPNRWAALGGSSTASTSWLIGLIVMSNGPTIEIRVSSPTTITPIIGRRWVEKRRQKAPMPTWLVRRCETDASSAKAPPTVMLSAILDPRVERRVEQVDDEVDGQEHHR